jgi:hypothetical protein
MIWSKGDDNHSPSPELLAAYLDGELEGNPAGERLRQRVETWLAGHPQAAAELDDLRRLKQLWQATTPADPGEAAWSVALGRLEATLSSEPAGAAPRRHSRHLLAWVAGIFGASAAAIWLWLSMLGASPGSVPPAAPRQILPEQLAEVEPFPVATADEVEIVSVAGQDTGTVVVGQLPVGEPMVLAGPGEVSLTSVCPAPPDNMLPDVLMGEQRKPMIWARLEHERDQR